MGWNTLTGWRRRARDTGVGVGLALIYGLALYGLRQSGTHHDEGPAYFVLLIVIPFVAPSLAVGIIDPDGRNSRWQHALTGFSIALLMLLAGVVMLKEGGVCTVMASPFFLLLAPLGAVWNGSRRRAARLRATAGPRLHSFAWLLFPVVALPLEQQWPRPLADTVVTSTAIIAAPTTAVWEQLVEVRHIRPSELDWTFSQDVAGVPKPTDARLDRRGVGGVRHVQWGPDVAFAEVVTRWQPGRELAWRFAFPSTGFGPGFDRHINPDSDQLKVADGSYRLDALPGGRTRLTLTTHYRVRTSLNDYCNLWGRVFVGDFHTNVLHVIKGRVERA